MYLRPEDTSGGVESTAMASESKEFRTFNMTQTVKSSIDAATTQPNFDSQNHVTATSFMP